MPDTVTTWQQILVGSFQTAFNQVLSLAPNVLAMLVVLVVGYVVARVAGRVIATLSEKVGLDARFGSARWRTGITGAPILADAVVSFDCRIIDEKAIGTHSVFFCEVLGLPHDGEDEALIYYRRAYHRLGSASRMDN